MTTQKNGLKDEMVAFLQSKTTCHLKEMAQKLVNDDSAHSTVIFCFVLSELESRLDESEYLAFESSL